MKKIIILLFILASLFSCQSEEEVFLTKEEDQTDQRQLKAKPDIDYRHLGWSIDMTGDYLSLNAIKSPVIDVKKFEQDFNSHIVSRPEERYVESKNFYGDNSEEYIKDMNYSLSVSYPHSKQDSSKMFSGTISGNYKNKQSYAENYSFVGKDEIVRIGKTYFVNKDPAILRKYLDKDFLWYVNQYSAEQIVAEYGTHVLLDITLGGKMSLLYRSEVIKTTKETTVKAGFTAVLKTEGISGGYEGNTTLIQNNKKAKIIIKSSGGVGGVSASVDLTSSSLPSYKDDISKWNASIVFSNSVPVVIESTIPIYELISDPTKRNNTKKAVEEYIKKRQLDLLTPLYRYWHAKRSDHFYSIGHHPDGFSGWAYEGMMGYIYYKTKVPGTVTLYEFWDEKGWDHLYTTWGGGIPPKVHEGRWKLSDYITGYIYPNKVEGTIPLYGFWNVKKWDHLVSLDRYPPELSYGWIYENIVGYIYPVVKE